MSFSSETKAELCRIPVSRTCCAVAEAYGILLFAHTFSHTKICMVTSSEPLARRIPPLFTRAFSVPVHVPDASAGGRFTIKITEPSQIARIFSALGYDVKYHVSYHLNRNVIDEECCRAAFLRGVFLAAGAVAGPEKKTHLELSTSHHTLCREVMSLMLDMDLSPKLAARKTASLLYWKDSAGAEDFLTLIGAPLAAMQMMQAKVEKQLRNTVNRQVNCETANVIKASNAAAEQIATIRAALEKGGWEVFPDALHETIRLRLEDSTASLAELAARLDPPISKPGLSHRLRRIVTIAKRVTEEQNT
ncbi:MAG: DNA-binding protein WhiA [Eubacteriales bacterium]|nr:DNA-binding protein WhiA [Eubacteriales bacterium]